jgi:hypothetical protein
MQKYKLKNTNINRVYYAFKRGHCLDKFYVIYLAEAYAKYGGGKIYTLYNKTDLY